MCPSSAPPPQLCGHFVIMIPRGGIVSLVYCRPPPKKMFCILARAQNPLKKGHFVDAESVRKKFYLDNPKCYTDETFHDYVSS